MLPFPPHSACITDLYELTMAAAYYETGFSPVSSFELFVRSLPPQRAFLIAAGLEQALDYLQNLRFQEDEIEYLRRLPVFANIQPSFFEYLKDLRFEGDVWAVPEGTVIFGEEPLLRVTAPIIQAQIVETFLLSMTTFQTMIASKAARVAQAAQGRRVVEFGSRRAHGPGAGVLAARAAYIGGCAGTSNVEAGRRYGVPVFGTLAHSFVMAYQQEEEAFRQFNQLFPRHSVLLVDTYDTLGAIEKIIHSRLQPRAVRLDSGDLPNLSRQVRRRLDEAGLQKTQIFASGDLDEFAISSLLQQGAPIDSFGVGTALATSADAPSLGGVYKLVDVESSQGISYRAKFSSDKITYPGRKQVFRFRHADGTIHHDIIACEGESPAGGEPLLQQVMHKGVPTGKGPALPEVRKRAQAEVQKIPAEYTQLRPGAKYPVSYSRDLQALLRLVRHEITQQEAVQPAPRR
jgi:nicotinate phosphoribosyltransferase